MTYMGNEPIPGMTIEQQKACAAACKLTGPADERHDGLQRHFLRALPGDPPWSDADVEAAIRSVLADFGIDTPFLLEQSKKK